MRHNLQPVLLLRYARFSGVCVIIIVLLLLSLGPIYPVPIAAQDETPRAGLVVQFGEDSLQTACVELGPDGEATGEEVLRAAGFDTVIDYTSGFGGGTVCKVSDQGCDFPAEACFCQCTMRPGDPCVYWTYFRLVDGQWRYSNLGITNTTLRPGEVEAWVWGPGGTSAGAAPPVITFDEICGVSSGPAVAPSATPSPPPTGTPADAVVPAATGPAASATAPPTVPATGIEEQPPTAAPLVASAAVQTADLTATATNAPAKGAGNLMGYAAFGVLVLLLGGGVFVMKGRGST